jgi:hypothetical protein
MRVHRALAQAGLAAALVLLPLATMPATSPPAPSPAPAAGPALNPTDAATADDAYR